MTIAVEFVDAATGQPFARSDIPVDQLPATFAVETTLDLAGESWSVVRADPPTAAEFRASGRLVLTLRRVAVMSPADILYSLPTLCDELPGVAAAGTELDNLRLHEDSWRQVELISASLADVVAVELDAVRRIYDEHAVVGDDGGLRGFHSLHVRTAPASPLIPPLPEPRLRQMLPTQRGYAAVEFLGAPGTVIDSFAFEYGPIQVYGLAADETITVLGLELSASAEQTAAELTAVMRAFNLTLVDWCRCAMVGPDSVDAYLQAIR